ncbi:hypothetical protein ACFYP4_17970 [Streptomyces sp. NPDC005551]|uniref:hypothetical protein n=1 Tax=unclassified Streptomyces TaxID=2593676 RepID=UPI0033EF0BDB
MFAHNTSAGGGTDLDLFHPKDGSPRLDQPLARVDEAEAEQIAAVTGGSGHRVSGPSRIPAAILEAVVEAGSRV